MKHTELPWHYQEDSDTYTHIIRDPSGSRIVAQFRQDTSGLPEANAAFIVKACNNHYTLLEALKDLMPVLQQWEPDHSSGEELRAWGRAVMAIKEAEQ